MAPNGSSSLKYRVPRVLKITSSALLILIAAVVSLLSLNWPFSQARVTESLETTFPATVTYTKFRSTYFPRPGCIADGVVFHWLASKPGARPIATVESFRVEGHYWDLLLRPGYIAHMIIWGFRINVPPVGTPREPYNWHETPSHLRVAEINADGTVVTIGREDGDPPLVFDVHTARLTSVTRHQPISYALTFHNPLPPGEIRARGQFGPWDSKDPGTTQFSGIYSFWNAYLGVFHGIAGTLSSHDQFHGPLRHIDARGDIDIPNFSVVRSGHSVHLQSSFHAFVDGLNGDVFLEKVNSRFLKTDVDSGGKIASEPGRHGKTAQIDFFVGQGRIQDVLWMFVSEPKPPLNGVTSFRAHATLPPGKTPFLQRVALTGDFGIVGGKFTKGSTQEDVTGFSERARGLHPNDKKKKDKGEKEKNANETAKNKNNTADKSREKGSEDATAGNYEQDPDRDRVISELSGHVQLRRKVATLSEFSFTVPGVFARMHGTYHIETHALNLHGTLKTDATLSHTTTGFKSRLLKPFDIFFKKKPAGAVVPAHLTGTYENPQPGVDIISKSAQTNDSNP